MFFQKYFVGACRKTVELVCNSSKMSITLSPVEDGQLFIGVTKQLERSKVA